MRSKQASGLSAKSVTEVAISKVTRQTKKIDNNWREGQGPVIDRLLFCAYGLQMSYVLFFDRLCRCLHCGRDTYACVEENSGTINCTECDEIIFDARDTSGTVVILELEEETTH